MSNGLFGFPVEIRSLFCNILCVLSMQCHCLKKNNNRVDTLIKCFIPWKKATITELPALISLRTHHITNTILTKKLEMLQISQSVTRNTKWAMLLETWCRLDRHTSDPKHSCRKQYLRIDNRIGETRMAERGLWSRSSRSLSSHSHICICCQLCW